MLCRVTSLQIPKKSASRYENLFNDMALPAERNGTW
jgi:hypothetical protein